jgi:hypothetical protein
MLAHSNGTNAPHKAPYDFGGGKLWNSSVCVAISAGLRHLHAGDLRRKRRLTLRNLDLHLCPRINDVRALAALTQLQRLDLSGCWSITDVRALAALTQLQRLDLSRCRNITDVSAISTMPQLLAP